MPTTDPNLEAHARSCERRRTRLSRAAFEARCAALHERVADFGPSRNLILADQAAQDRIDDTISKIRDRLADEHELETQDSAAAEAGSAAQSLVGYCAATGTLSTSPATVGSPVGRTVAGSRAPAVVRPAQLKVARHGNTDSH